MESQPARRHLPLEGAFNFRDAGGLETTGGRTLKTGLLFRSDELSRLTEVDLERVEQLGLKSICDLRTPHQRRSKPDRLPPGGDVRLVHVPIPPPAGDMNRWQFFWMLTSNARDLDCEAQIRQIYRHVAFACTARIREVFELISDPEQLPTLIHCTAGKDRTGYLAALVQLLAGVPREAVIDDYLVTNRLIGAQAERYIRILRWFSLFRISRQRLQPLIEVRREYLEEVLDEVLERYGSIGAYLTEACGVDAGDLKRLERSLVD